MNRIDRLSAILTMLQSSPSIDPKQITKRFGISIRTVYRDIRALEETGIPIAGDSRTGYSLVDGYKLPPLMFTQEEAFAFLAAERLVDKFSDSGLQAGYKLGVDKIKAVMRLTEKDTMATIDKRIGHLDFHSSSFINSQSRLQSLLNSIFKRNKIEIEYLSYGKQEKTRRVIDPIGVFFSMSNWYLIGFCNYRKDYRTFKVSRIQEIQQTNIPVNQNHPSLDTFLQKLREEIRQQKAIIEIRSKDLPITDESKYYQGLVSEEIKDDIVSLHFMTFSLERLARWYLSYMDIATIIYPEELKAITKAIIKKSKNG